MTFSAIANIKNHAMSEHFYDNINRYLLTTQDGPYRITIKKYKKQRTEPQNRYYFGVVVDILAKELGYTKDEMHDALRDKFLKVATDIPDLFVILSTTSLNTEEFNQYIEEIKRWAATDLSIYIPDPNEEEGAA